MYTNKSNTPFAEPFQYAMCINNIVCILLAAFLFAFKQDQAEFFGLASQLQEIQDLFVKDVSDVA